MTSNDMICEDFCVGFPTLAAKAQPKEEGRADRTLPELQEEAISWMYLTKTTIWYPFHQSLREMKG